ncbi:MAG: transposase [Leptospiraceae bacterium]|nr:transposase [Leptospiraceae bacterium]
MSRKGNCWDNSVMESFFYTLKLEAVPKEGCSSFEDAKIKLFDYLERYYNRCRKHSAIGYQKPSLMYENFVAKLCPVFQRKITKWVFSLYNHRYSA